MNTEYETKTELQKTVQAALKESGFQVGERIEIRPLENVVVLVKEKMNASELISAVCQLERFRGELDDQLMRRCEPCTGCDCECPFGTVDFAVDIALPQELRELAEMAPHDPVHVESFGDGSITFSTSRDEPGLWDVPPAIMREYLAKGVCPASLEKLMNTGETVYGA